MESILLTVPETAKLLSLSTRLVQQLVANGTLPSLTIGRTRRVPREVVEAFVANRLEGRVGG